MAIEIKKKHLIIGGLAIISTAAALAYWQYTKIMNYCLSFKSLKLNKLSPNLIDFNIFLNFKNNSDTKFTIIEQSYDVYINNKPVTVIKNVNPDIIEPIGINNPTGTKVMELNIKFNPEKVLKDLGGPLGALAVLAKPDKAMIKIDCKFYVKIWGIKVSIPYLYEASLKELATPTPTNQADPNANKCK